MAAKKGATRNAAKTTPKKATKKTPKKAATKKSAKKASRAPAKKAATEKVGGRPGTAGKAEGDAPVFAYIESLSPAHQAIARKLDAAIVKNIPDAKRAVKWSMPFYGRPGRGWICSFASFKNYVALSFFAGTSLSPPPPEGAGKGHRRVRYPDLQAVDEKQLDSWLSQAAKLEGWGKM